MIYEVIRKISNRVNNFYLPIHYKLFPVESGINKSEERSKKIIVSLTSIPSRFDKIHLCLESLLRQTYKPDKIILYLGNESCKQDEITTKIENLKEKGITVEFRKDIGPHTKYFYAMSEFPNDIVITVDDDIYYSSNLIETLIKSYTKYPNSVSCMRAHKIEFDEENKIKPYNEWIGECSDITKPSAELLATGVGGVLYPPKLLYKDTLKEELIREHCLKADDIWLKFMQILNNIEVVVADPKNTHIRVIDGSQEIALHKSNVSLNQNDVYINKLAHFYQIDLFNKIKENK